MQLQRHCGREWVTGRHDDARSRVCRQHKVRVERHKVHVPREIIDDREEAQALAALVDGCLGERAPHVARHRLAEQWQTATDRAW